jgi:hypothetical protein
MKPVVFLGPSLALGDARRALDAIYLPPVAQGDIYRAAREGARAIGIIDGYFERRPAVWHKEVLWALTHGVHVFGGASMGALRAAELARFGMIGVGRIFEAYRSGALEDDDEVAVAHADASAGYRATSEAMVNIRATLESAEMRGALRRELRLELERIAKELFYPDRSYPQVFARALERGLPAEELERVRTFVLDGRVDQKRADALALLKEVASCYAAGVPRGEAPYSLSHTAAWDEVVDWAATQPPLLTESETVPAALVAAEVRLSGPDGHATLAAGLTRVLAGMVAHARTSLNLEAHADAYDRLLRHSRSDEEFQRWLQEQDLTQESYRALLDRTVVRDWAAEHYRDEVDRHVADEARLAGDYQCLRKRALEKEALLAEHGLSAPTVQDAGVTADAVLRWYFERKMKRPMPPNLNASLGHLGFVDLAALLQEALRELVFIRLSTGEPEIS